ncbi:hypothetical protein H2200_005619 [Cladophialophora chaetospira]|uniref:Uncharacterized protein n=1 Tax=Cladophialophora chaetospira TaxID=386627 RepID=A0AA38XCG6_9EURO|nr:hypothetical protein H2200_005619 [Cladophialophora chaetospira]
MVNNLNLHIASNTKVCILVIADGREQPVRLSNAVHDSVASKSLISKSKATASRGSVKSSTSTTVTDHSGTTYTSKSTIALRWYYEDGTQTFPETFHIVESATKDLLWDAILCKTAESPAAALVPQAHPHFGLPNGKDGKREDERRVRAAMDQERYKKERQEQAERIRNAYVKKHAGAVKHG